jgi:kinesin family protein 5
MVLVPLFPLQRALSIATAGSATGESFAQSTQEAERLRKAMEIQHAEFEISKKSLVKDLQNRCEKACPPSSYLMVSST